MELVKNKDLQIFVAVFSAMGGLAALLVYLDNRKSRVLKEDVARLDREIKTLELAKKKREIAAAKK